MTERLSNNNPENVLAEVQQMTTPIFERMGQAEDEIQAAMQTDPVNADIYNSSFLLLLPTDTLISERLYRKHCQEMLGRAARCLDTRPGTDAEVLGALSAGTLVAPPGGEWSLAYARLFRRLFPENVEYVDELERSVGRERHHGSVDELIGDLRKKLTVADRAKDKEQ